ncbi:cuticular protein-like, partial [Tropilaelaps mercedesae]
VSYVADEHGFRAKVDTNEPGTASEGPASIHFHSSDPKIAHAPIRHKGGYGDWRSKERDHGGLAGEYPGHYGGWQLRKSSRIFDFRNSQASWFSLT